MIKYTTKLGIFLLLTVFACSPSLFAKTKTIEQNFDEMLETLQSFYPVKSTLMGIHSYDHRLADYSSNSVKNMITRLTNHEKTIKQLERNKLTDEQRTDLKLIKSNIDIVLLDLKQIKWQNKLPQLYIDEAIDGIYSLVISEHAPMSEKVYSIISRMKEVPSLFKTAQRNIKTPAPIWIELAKEQLETGIEFYRQIASELMNQFPEKADDILKESTAAREAMNDFLVFLGEIPTGDSTSFAIGKQNFDYMLSNEYFLPYDSDSLLKIGEAELAKVQADYREYESYIENNRQNGEDSVYVPTSFNRDDLLNYMNWEAHQVKFFVESNDLISVPENIAPLEIKETPDFLRPLISAIAYHPAGPFDEIQKGYFYIRPIPKDLDQKQLAARYRFVHRRGFKGSVVHEAYPGHHLQMQIAAMNESKVRKWQENTMMIEGWALYCEEMMYQAGLYGDEDPAMWLAILDGIRFRAARIIADVKLHTNQFTYDECVNWMFDVLDADTKSEQDYLRNSVRKYTLTPTTWMSYLMGKREIEKLKEAYKMKEGVAFSELEFHDKLLSEASIPPALIWDIWGLKK